MLAAGLCLLVVYGVSANGSSCGYQDLKTKGVVIIMLANGFDCTMPFLDCSVDAGVGGKRTRVCDFLGV